MKKDINKIGFIGKCDDHYKTLLRKIDGSDVMIIPFNYYSIYHVYNHDKMKAVWSVIDIFRRATHKINGINSAEYLSELREYLDKHQINCVIAHWGLNPAADIITIKKIRPDITIILNVLCHPMGTTQAKIFMQNKYFRYLSQYLDGIIYSSNAMKLYFEEKVLRSNNMPNIVLYPLSFQYSSMDTQEKMYPKVPNIIFIGRADWWAGQKTDNVIENLDSFMNVGIHVYHSNPTGIATRHENQHFFPSMGLNDLKNYSLPLDASLIMYNLHDCILDDRFRITIPDRLIASVSFGIPIAIPKKGYDACKEYLNEYQAVIEFESPEDLKAQLEDRDKINELKMLARVNAKKYLDGISFDYLRTFLNFIKSVD